VNLLDLILIVVFILAALNGYRRGAALQLASYAGLLLGLLAGALIAPSLAGLASSSPASAAIALVALLAMAALGDALGWVIGVRIWALARRSALGSIDSAAGSIVAVVAVLLATWFIAYNLANGPFPALAGQIRGSAIVRGVDDALPRPPGLLSEVRQFLNRFGFPQVFEGVPPAPAGPVQGPTQGQAAAVAHRVAASTVRIVGQGCGGVQEGSGFVVAPHYVVTNAHVVAGIADPQVQRQNGGSQPGRVVLFDPRVDVAVLLVSAEPGPPLRLVPQDVSRGAKGAVLGYPGGGSLTFGAAAVRRDLNAIGRDIYGRSVVTRDVYELQAVVRPGNSGGPFVLLNGEVAGIVFAASTTDGRVGYALTSTEVMSRVRSGEQRTGAVSTDGCAH
jgi:S1-C subfamily serine protease